MAAALVELRREFFVHFPQMGHVVERVFDLAFGERAAGPVGEARGFVDRGARQPAGQRLVARGFAEAAYHGGDLGVEDRRRHLAVEVVEDFEVLARGVEHLQHLGIVHQPEQRIERDARGQRVDGGGVIRPRHLHQAKLRPIGLVAHEFGVDRDIGLACVLPAEGIERFGAGYQRGHALSLTPKGRPPKGRAGRASRPA